MSDRIRLHMMGISYSQLETGAYALVLAQDNGPYRIPIIIGSSEAQSIAIALEGLPTPRPLTHDLFVSFAHAFGVKLKEVFIYRFEDGIFSSEMTFSDGERQVAIDARTSDAIAVAIRTNTPILTTTDVLSQTGLILEEVESENGTDSRSDVKKFTVVDRANPVGDNNTETESETKYSDDSYHAEAKPENYTVEELERTLARLIENEDYEQAALINEILKNKTNKK